jgi:hypothetical protein
LSGPEQVHFDLEEAKAAIETILPKSLPEHITHKKLRAKLALLRVDVLWLLNKMDEDTHPFVRTPAEPVPHVLVLHRELSLQDTFVDYAAKFPLRKFVPWFLRWALSLLDRSEKWFEEPPHPTVATFVRRHTPVDEGCCEENKENADQPERGSSETQYEFVSNVLPRAPLRELPAVVSFNVHRLASLPVDADLSPSVSSLTCTNAAHSPTMRRHPSAEGLWIVTDPAHLAEIALERKRREKEEAIQRAVATCDLDARGDTHGVEGDEDMDAAIDLVDLGRSLLSPVALKQVGLPSPHTVEQEESGAPAVLAADAPAAVEPHSGGVLTHLMSAVWEAFAPDSQQLDSSQPEPSTKPEQIIATPTGAGEGSRPALVSPPLGALTAMQSAGNVSSTHASSDSLVYSVTTAGARDGCGGKNCDAEQKKDEDTAAVTGRWAGHKRRMGCDMRWDL